MEYLIGLFVILGIWWFLRTKRYDKQALLDFDVWTKKYQTAASQLEQLSMATAFVMQSVHFAWSSGAINGKQKDAVMNALEKIGAKNALVMWMGSSLPVVIRVVGESELSGTPARAVGMLMLLVWMSPDQEGENNLRGFLFRR